MSTNKLRKYFTLMKSGVMEQLQFRTGIYVTILGNLIYLVIIYFLWKAIFASVNTKVVNGMTFEGTMIYLVLAMALFTSLGMSVVWDMGRNVQSGKIVLDIIKPMKFESYMFWQSSGNYVMTFVTTFIPTAVIVYFITHGGIPLGINLVYFMFSLIIGWLISFYIDLFTGTICLHTQSIWGVNIMKDVLVLLLSGASVPIAFFPKLFQTIVYYLPFQAVYNTPLKILIDASLTDAERFRYIGIQLFWVLFMAVVTKLFWRASLKKITVNGG